MIRVFIGYDAKEAIAFSVLCHSIHHRSSEPVSITPLLLPQLACVFERPRDPLQSTDFAFTRFLVPSLSEFQGWSIYMDCDMLMLDDIARLWSLRDDRYPVMVVKHGSIVGATTKWAGHTQTAYDRKNWSSVMLFNNAKCHALSSQYVRTAPGLDLHQFRWLADDAVVGELPQQWNYLVGVSDSTSGVSLVHFTLGGPYYEECAQCEFASEWRAERDAMLRAV